MHKNFGLGVTEDEAYEGYEDFFLKKFPNHLIQNNEPYLCLGGEVWCLDQSSF